jgi:hypothetical protein
MSEVPRRLWASRRLAFRRVVAVAVVLIGVASAFGARADVSASSSRTSGSFVSLAQVRGGMAIERFALGTGRQLGILARVPAIRSTSEEVDVSEPHLTSAGSYVITLGHDVTCEPGPSSECVPVGGNTCGSRIEDLDPASRRYTTLFTEPGRSRVFDAIPSPNGRSFALMERGCSTDTFRIVIRGPSGREFALGTYNPACGVEPTGGWSADAAQLVFVDDVRRASDCSLVVASSRHPSSSSPYRFVAPDAECSFRSATFDSEGIAAIEICGAGDSGGTTKLLQLSQGRHVVRRIDLPQAQPAPFDDGDANVVNDEPAHAVLVTQNLPGHPAATRIWTFDGSRLHLITITSRPLTAEP